MALRQGGKDGAAPMVCTRDRQCGTAAKTQIRAALRGRTGGGKHIKAFLTAQTGDRCAQSVYNTGRITQPTAGKKIYAAAVRREI